jgi:predicted neuraminidase
MKKLLMVLIALLLFTSLSIAKPYFKKEKIFPYQPKHVHSSSIVQSPNGDFLVCWFHGSGERTEDDVLVQGSRLRKGSDQWEDVFLMADTPGFPDCNPVLFIDAKDRLWLFWIPVLAHSWEQSILKYRIADNYNDDGPPVWNWQDIIALKPGEKFAQAVEEGFKNNSQDAVWAEFAPAYEDLIIEASKDKIKRQMGWMPRVHPFVLESGRILLPIYSDGFCLGLVAISDDVGETWRASKPMVGIGLNQPTIVQKNGGTLVAYMRNEGIKPMRVLKSESIDEGETWSFAEFTDIPNPESSLEVIKLDDGTWLMIFNDTEDGRHSLAAALSDDEGATWKWKNHIALVEPRQKSFSYPSVIQSKDGLIHVTYSYAAGPERTIKHAVFNKEWVKQK